MINRGLLLGLCLLTPGPAWAERLFVPNAAGSARASETIRVDGAVARDLASHRRSFVLDDVPLAAGGRASFALSPIEVFTADAEIIEFDGVLERAIGRPDITVYEGVDIEVPDRTLVLSIADGSRVGVLVRDGSRVVSLVQPDPSSDKHVLLDPTQPFPEDPPNLCENHRAPPGMLEPFGVYGALPDGLPQVADAPPGPTLALESLIDVSHNLYTGRFGSSSSMASQYAASLIGAVSGIYRRDVNVVVLIKQLVIWTGPDPFGGSNTATQLAAYRTYNVANRAGVARDVAHLLANVYSAGGRAYLNVLCNNAFGYGVSNINGNYTSLPAVGYVWDVKVVAHELGHNFGSGHTHCYVPPLDHCYASEAGCYSGPVTPSVGEIMSYCHLVGSIEMGFSSTVASVIRARANAGSCIGLAPGICGNGILEAGEVCDDGNVDNGDCCSSNCVAEVGRACTDDDDPCTTDACTEAGECGHTPPGTCTPCGSAVVIPEAGGTFAGTTSGASTRTSACGGTGPERIYSWTPSASGLAKISTCGSDFDTVLHVHTGACAGGPAVTCNNDSTCGSSSAATFIAIAGATYFVVVDGYNGAQGNFNLSLDPAPFPVCEASPLPSCKLPTGPGKAMLKLKSHANNTKDRLSWKWGNGEATSLEDLGAPDDDDYYQLCIYDSGGLKLAATMMPSGACTPKPCWTRRQASLMYRNKARLPNGIQSLGLKSSLTPGKAKIGIKGSGARLGMPSLGEISAPIRVQLVRPGGPCWEAVYSMLKLKPDGSMLSGKSD